MKYILSMIVYEIKNETPSKKNGKIFNTKTHKMISSQKYRQWHEFAALEIKPYIKKCIKGKCYIVLLFTHGDNIHRDSDNGVSSIFDALQDFGALEDDRWQIVRNHHVFNTYEKGNAWCKIFIFEPEEKENYKKLVTTCIDEFE